ncbi:ROK family transcriptional regulator [Saccharibacillus brassicae]|uniref:ROK family protein n=1 Tax=Saccharibacillus brassicae TaxID=2583377 RepID=A0A4Y6V3V7_SACBS|nr:ROK family protein [Saccharibacillus brassicae]QDH23197.1 ROK family protein [Saccharibacillus brassicae]
MKRADTMLMKEINLNAVRQTLKRKESATKPQLSAETGLSVVTVAALVRELAERGELTEEEAGPSTGGRPATVYRYDYQHSLALVMHLHEQGGVDTVFASVVDLRGEELGRDVQVFDDLDEASALDWIEGLLLAWPGVRTVAIGIPGQAVDGTIEVSSHERLIGLRPAQLIGDRFGLPVQLENDVNAALQGWLADKSEAGASRAAETDPAGTSNEADEEDEANEAGQPDEADEAENGSGIVLGLYFPEKYPPGLAISIDGRTVAGKKGMAGEIKYLPLGIDWSRPPQGAAFDEAACKLAHTAAVLLAPERIVLYGTRTEQASWSGVWKAYVDRHPLPAEPDLRWSGQFAEHFAAGMRELALKALEPKLPYAQIGRESGD